MKTALAALTAAVLLGTASATDLRIYQNFGEVRDTAAVQQGRVTVSLPINLYGSILPDSLDLDGVNVTSRSLVQQANWLATLEGQPVTLLEDGKRERVTLVRARDLLIKDAQGQYRTVPAERLAFDQVPPENPLSPSWLASFTVAGSGTPTLTYLTRALSWTPRYTLKLSGSAASLSALADLRNGSDQPFNVSAAELYAGDVPLENGQPMPAPYARAEMAAPVAADSMGVPKVSSQGELRGLYRYGLQGAFTLPANGSVSLPFLNPKVSSFERYGVLERGFSAGGDQGNLDRGYRLKTDTELPGGPVTVREDGRLVGQVSVDTTPAGTALELDLGTDPDLTYTRSAVSSKVAGGTAIRVTYTFQNAKDRPVRFEVTEQGLSSRAALTGQATRTATNGLLVRVDVPAKQGTTPGKLVQTFTVTVPAN
ncbi:hypothetical protein [Deinococcus sonorensis]|uniref:DUF4139 domain-containing protein n=2 Tax=Deinococcus sonorensis TaxID=309891 RepID=A0AAU7UBM8_9DEIO